MPVQGKTEQMPTGARKIRVGKLDTLGQIGAEIKRLFRAGRHGDIPTADAKRLAEVLKIAVEVTHLKDIQDQLDRLEGAKNPHTHDAATFVGRWNQ